MKDRFPHINDTAYPFGEQANPYKYKNEYPYDNWKPTAKIRVYNVQWDSHLEHVPGFESHEEKMQWFADHEPLFEWETDFHQPPRDVVKLPAPYEVLMDANYLTFTIPQFEAGGFTSEEKMYPYFIEEIDQSAPNTTACAITRDVWTQYVGEFKVNRMNLLRGHAPMAAAPTPEEYLASPMDNSSLLRSPDADLSTGTWVSKRSFEYLLNDSEKSMYACVISWADFDEDEPSYHSSHLGYLDPNDKSTQKKGLWWTPATSYVETQGVPAPHCWAFKVEPLKIPDPQYPAIENTWDLFWQNVDDLNPEFKSTVLGVFFAPFELLKFDEERRIKRWATRIYKVEAQNSIAWNPQLSVSDFGYATQYRDITKLYTYPYAHLRIGGTIIRIEDIDGDGPEFFGGLQMAFPYISFDLRTKNVGGDMGTGEFSNLEVRSYSRSHELSQKFSLDVPVFSISQPAAKVWEYTGWVDKEANYSTSERNLQAQLASIEQSYLATLNSLAAQRSATLITNQAGIDNTAITNELATSQTNRANAIADMNRYVANHMTWANHLVTQGSLATQLDNAYRSNAATSAQNLGSVVSSIVDTAVSGGFMGAMGGAVGGPAGMGIGAVAGAAVGVVTGLINAGTSENANNISMTNTAASIAQTSSSDDWVTNETYAVNDQAYNTESEGASRNTAEANEAAEKIVENNNDATLDVVDLQIASAKANAASARETAIYGATQGTYANREAVSASIQHYYLSPPATFGGNNGADATGEPTGLFLEVVTEPDNSISFAGDAMLRYGYTYGRNWPFQSFNVRPHFSYWQAEDVWLDFGNMSNKDERVLKAMLKQGITVWKDPDEIGKVGLYD